MKIEISNDELRLIRYALDQQSMTLRQLIKDGKTVIVQPLLETFETYVEDMGKLLESLPEL